MRAPGPLVLGDSLPGRSVPSKRSRFRGPAGRFQAKNHISFGTRRYRSQSIANQQVARSFFGSGVDKYHVRDIESRLTSVDRAPSCIPLVGPVRAAVGVVEFREHSPIGPGEVEMEVRRTRFSAALRKWNQSTSCKDRPLSLCWVWSCRGVGVKAGRLRSDAAHSKVEYKFLPPLQGRILARARYTGLSAQAGATSHQRGLTSARGRAGWLGLSRPIRTSLTCIISNLLCPAARANPFYGGKL